MILGKVIDTVVSTRKSEGLVGYKIMIVRELDVDGTEGKNHIIAVDSVGAGIGDKVLVCDGENSRFACRTQDIPVDAVIVGIVD